MTPAHGIAPCDHAAPRSYQAGDEPIPGYRLQAPLGKGGFGEVWRCEAPGGFSKAIKFVHSASARLDDAQHLLAEQEQRAIDFIKNIRHPFILTVERAELLHGTLMIVMELADQSLADLLAQIQQRGEAGIARADLLGYLAETAEALDIMNFQHGLQHLDVKPQNLFLVGGHVKVADFGLVNRLPDDAASTPAHGTNGLTPRYVAPEILRHQISRRSDQYSLAIVYQELLTGTVPFKGRTGRQLIMQHLQALPDLAALPAPERGPVARALAKDPEERFASCGDFVRALSRAAPSSVPTPGDAARTPLHDANTTAELRTDPAIHLSGNLPLDDLAYIKPLGQTPLGELWQLHSARGETLVGYHLHGFTVETVAAQERALAYLQKIRHVGLVRFKVAELAPHRIILVAEPWGLSLSQRCRQGQVRGADLLRTLGQVARTLDEVTAHANLEHLAVSPDTIVSGVERVQLRDFGLIALLWKSAGRPLDALNPRYSAPELAQGHSSPASDQYSLAVTYTDLRMFELRGAAWPTPRTLGKSRSTIVSLEDLSPRERQVLRQATELDPARRFGSCAEFVDALTQARTGAVPATAAEDQPESPQRRALGAVHDWIALQEKAGGPAAGLAADGTLRHVAEIDIVPGTARVRLGVFQQEWPVTSVPATDHEFRYFLPLKPTFWQRLRGTQPGVSVRVELESPKHKDSRRHLATITMQPQHGDAAAIQQFTQTLGPGMLKSILAALNAVGERRTEKRWPCPSTALIHQAGPSADPEAQPATVLDLSRNGIAFVTKSALATATPIRVAFTLPRADGESAPVSLDARVTHCDRRARTDYAVAAEFVRAAGQSA